MPDQKPRTLNRMTALQIRGPARGSGYLLMNSQGCALRQPAYSHSIAISVL
jgi:hypothetical protein